MSPDSPLKLIFNFRFTGDSVEGEIKDEEEPTGLSLVAATMRQMKKRQQQLLIPLTIWVGLQQGFFGADFTAVSYCKLPLT